MLHIASNKLIVSEQWFVDNWFAQFSGRIDNQFIAHRLLKFERIHPFMFSKIIKHSPVKNVVLVFTNGYSNGRTTYGIDCKKYVEQTSLSSAQIVKLWDVTMVLQLLENNSLNCIVTIIMFLNLLK